MWVATTAGFHGSKGLEGRLHSKHTASSMVTLLVLLLPLLLPLLHSHKVLR